MNKADVTLEEKREIKKIALVNLGMFLLQMIVILVTSEESNSSSVFLFSDIDTPVSMHRYAVYILWTIVFI